MSTVTISPAVAPEECAAGEAIDLLAAAATDIREKEREACLSTRRGRTHLSWIGPRDLSWTLLHLDPERGRETFGNYKLEVY